MKLNHKTPDEFRREVALINFKIEDCEFESVIHRLLNAYEDCEDCKWVREETSNPKFSTGDKVFKVKGSEWRGTVVGHYSTELTPDGVCVESESHRGSVQIYPAAALEMI